MRLSVLILFLFYASSAFSQKADSLPAFGKIDKADLLMSECTFDKNAEAVVLFDAEEVHFKLYNFDVYTEISRRIRIKILKNKGLDRANIKITYFSRGKIESINNINAQTY